MLFYLNFRGRIGFMASDQYYFVGRTTLLIVKVADPCGFMGECTPLSMNGLGTRKCNSTTSPYVSPQSHLVSIRGVTKPFHLGTQKINLVSPRDLNKIKIIINVRNIYIYLHLQKLLMKNTTNQEFEMF